VSQSEEKKKEKEKKRKKGSLTSISIEKKFVLASQGFI